MKHNNVQLDSRSVQDLRGEIRRLAASYTPEWAFSDVNPDVGSVVGLIFANQMEENIRRMNLVMEKYHTEFVNMLNLSLRPAYPAGGGALHWGGIQGFADHAHCQPAIFDLFAGAFAGGIGK